MGVLRTAPETVIHPVSQMVGLLQLACAGHTDEQTHPDSTVQTCWDADRLDLGRVGITPEPRRLCTAAAKLADVLKRSHRHSRVSWRRTMLTVR
jgi:uncharacterized protein